VDRLIYSSLAAMRGSMARQQATANNLANANTPGFKADLAEAQAVWLTGPGAGARATANEEVLAADMRGGTVTATGRTLDVAVEGAALLSVQAVDGDEAYTRRGDLQLSPSGLLTTGDGRPVLGPGGPITLPPADSIAIDGEGRISVTPAGGGAAQEVARLKLVLPTGSDVAKGLDGLFRVKGGGVLPDDPAARVKSGHLEGSNVNATTALVDMIEAARAWDTNLKLIGDARDNDARSAELMRFD
jgi:flagellar basal-body rod protein FlgF